MADDAARHGGRGVDGAADSSPQRLAREAASLACILMVGLCLAVAERRGYLPEPAGISSLVLLGLSVWHSVHFRLGMRVGRGPRVRRTLPVVVAVVLIGLLLASARAPLSPRLSQAPPPWLLPHMLILVPLAEEFYFRGLLLDHLRRGFRTLPAVVLCSVLFGVLHLPAEAAIATGVLSLMACLAVVGGGTLACAVQLHVAWNAMSQIHRLGDPSTRWTWAVAAMAVVLLLAAGSLRRQRDDGRTG